MGVGVGVERSFYVMCDLRTHARYRRKVLNLIFSKIAVIAFVIGYCCKKTDFDDDHVFQEEELPTVFFDPDDPPSLGNKLNFVKIKQDKFQIFCKINVHI